MRMLKAKTSQNRKGCEVLKNVLLITDKLITGGAETYFCKLENQLNHPDITVYTAAATGELYSKIQYKKRFTPLSRKNHLHNLYVLWKKVRTCKIDIIHANSLRMVMYAVCVNRILRKKVKILYTKHNVTVLEQKAKSFFCKLVNSYVHGVITVSRFEQDQLMHLGVNSGKVTTIYNGVDLDQFVFKEKVASLDCHIGLLARASKEKNHELFIEIASLLRDHDHMKFHIGGGGPDLQRIQELIHQQGLSEKIKIWGEVEDPEAFITNMDMLLLTSHREVFPMVVLEAMAVGTPMISIDVGGVKEAIANGDTGYLIPTYSPEAFAEKIKELYAEQEQKQRFAKGARKKVEQHFTSSQMIASTAKQYVNMSGKSF